MAVPAHDERDHAFAKTYGLPIVAGRRARRRRAASTCRRRRSPTTASRVDSARASRFPTARRATRRAAQITAWLAAQGAGRGARHLQAARLGLLAPALLGRADPDLLPRRRATAIRARQARSTRSTTTSRSRVDESELPLRLPELEDFQPGRRSRGPARARAVDWRFFQKDGAWFARETNTMPQWAGSCWYYLRFLDPQNDDAACSSQRPTTRGCRSTSTSAAREHAVLHLLYARFWHKVLFDIGRREDAEPFTKLVHQGMILGENDEKMTQVARQRRQPRRRRARARRRRAAPLRDVHGAARGGEALADERHRGRAPLPRSRVERRARGALTDDAAAYDDATKRLVHKTIKKVTDDIEALRFNTAISAMMILVNHLGALPARAARGARRRSRCSLSPFAPHLGEELWQRLGARAIARLRAVAGVRRRAREGRHVVEIGVQVNGKVAARSSSPSTPTRTTRARARSRIRR